MIFVCWTINPIRISFTGQLLLCHNIFFINPITIAFTDYLMGYDKGNGISGEELLEQNLT